MNQNKIGELIEKLRKEKNLTQRELADILGVSNTAISKWENGNNLPDITMLEPLSQALDIDVLDLIKAQSNTYPDNTSKKNKMLKKNILKIIHFLIVILTIIGITNFSTYKTTNSKIKHISSTEVEIYRIRGKDENLSIDGYLIFNDKESIIFFKNIKYQGPGIGTAEFEKVKGLEFYIIMNKEKVYYFNKIINNKTHKINEFLEQAKVGNVSNNIDFKKQKDFFEESLIKVVIHNTISNIFSGFDY